MQTAVREDLLRYLQSGKQWRKSKMKTIRVVAAVIKAVNKTGESIIFATQRGYGELRRLGISGRKMKRRDTTGGFEKRNYGGIGYRNRSGRIY